jgi:hypothetical protein
MFTFGATVEAAWWLTLGELFLALIAIPSDYQSNTASREGVRYANRCSASKSGL